LAAATRARLSRPRITGAIWARRKRRWRRLQLEGASLAAVSLPLVELAARACHWSLPLELAGKLARWAPTGPDLLVDGWQIFVAAK